jgi:hypothetical protein
VAAPHADFASAIARAREHAPFLASALERLPELAAVLEGGDIEAALAHARSAGSDVPELATALRRERLALALALGIGDLAGALPLTRSWRAVPPSPIGRWMPPSSTRSAAGRPMPSPPASARSRWASTARRSSTTRPTSIRSCFTTLRGFPAASAMNPAMPRSGSRARWSRR